MTNLKEELEELVKDYYKKEQAFSEMILNEEKENKPYSGRYVNKRSVYRSVITDLNRILKDHENGNT